MLKNLITKSAGYDEEDTKLMYEGIVEERKERELLEERKRRDNLEQRNWISTYRYTGTVSLIREDISTKIVGHSRLSKINTVLYGLGQTEVITKDFFEYDFVLDKDQYSLAWHVVPTKQLNFEALIGTDILGQASLNFTQDGVMFHKHEEKACLMQISGVHPEDELDFSHILDSQVKNDLTRITSSYKPEKTE
ncbi:RVP domain-containing protein [Trichonephila clavipes]|nr:RVP domain-containing protein [Trichonephila clavipes]